MRVLSEVDRIARRGRSFGFRLISITQRPAKLHKDVLTQLSTLVALGVTSPQDRDAIKAWVEGNADRDKAREVYESLAGLKVGEGWVWAPDYELLKRVTFPAIETLDTSRTPTAGEARIERPVFAAADLDRLKGTFARLLAGKTPKAMEAKGRAKGKGVGRKRAAPAAKIAKVAKRAATSDPVGMAIVRARAAAGMTQEQLAQKMGTDRANVARLEQGRSKASTRTLQRVADATGHHLVVDFERVA